MKLMTLLTERFINLFSEDEMNKYAKEVWDILQLSYKPIGGFLTANSIPELIQKSMMWKLVRKNNKIVAVAIYKDSNGRKVVAFGTDGTPVGKASLYQIMKEDITQLDRSTWGEYSDAAEHIMLKKGGTPVPNTLAAKLTGKPILKLNPDGFHYTRIIAGEPHEKIIIGNIKK